MILADFAIFFYLNYLKVYLKVGYEPIKYIIPIPEEASNRMLRGSQVMEERILINADINYLKDFIREEQKVKGCYFRFDYILKDVGYFVYLIFNDNFIMYDLVNCYIDKFDKDITIYNKCNIVHKDIVISKKYVNFYKHYCESSFIREMLFISLCENYSVCKEELKVLLEYKNIQEQYNIR